MANVLKVFLENGQTKSFKYDTTTTVTDVVTSLKDKLCITAEEHFSLVVEHVKSLRRNKLTLLDPKESLARVRFDTNNYKDTTKVLDLESRDNDAKTILLRLTYGKKINIRY